MVSERSGELVKDWIYALEHGLKMTHVAAGIHVYPNLSRANAKIAGQLIVERLLEGTFRRPIEIVLRLLVQWIRRRRAVPQ